TVYPPAGSFASRIGPCIVTSSSGSFFADSITTCTSARKSPVSSATTTLRLKFFSSERSAARSSAPTPPERWGTSAAQAGNATASTTTTAIATARMCVCVLIHSPRRLVDVTTLHRRAAPVDQEIAARHERGGVAREIHRRPRDFDRLGDPIEQVLLAHHHAGLVHVFQRRSIRRVAIAPGEIVLARMPCAA